MSNRIPITHQSRRTIQANDPRNPRHPKPFRVSYYKTNEVDTKGYAVLHITEVMSRTAAEARNKVIFGRRRVVSSYKASGMYKLAKKLFFRRIYTLSPNFVAPEGIVPEGSPHIRKYPICKLPGCGKLNPRSKHYHTLACRRAAKNKRQLITKRKRLAVAAKNGITLCQTCAARPVGTFSPTRCNKCFLNTRKLWLPIKVAQMQTLRLQDQLPAVMNVLLQSKMHRCNFTRSNTGERVPRCGCRTHALQWLIINAERYAILRRPLQSYLAKRQPLPPWFQKTRVRRKFDKRGFERPGTMLSSNQSAMALAV